MPLSGVFSSGSGCSRRPVQNPSASGFPAGGQTDGVADGRLPHSVRQSRMCSASKMAAKTDQKSPKWRFLWRSFVLLSFPVCNGRVPPERRDHAPHRRVGIPDRRLHSNLTWSLQRRRGRGWSRLGGLQHNSEHHGSCKRSRVSL